LDAGDVQSVLPPSPSLWAQAGRRVRPFDRLTAGRLTAGGFDALTAGRLRMTPSPSTTLGTLGSSKGQVERVRAMADRPADADPEGPSMTP
jgi:hypothetical protein